MRIPWKIKQFINRAKKLYKGIRYCNEYYLCFTEEMIMNDQFPGYRAGRIEIKNSYLSPYSLEEQRIFTKSFNAFYEEFRTYMWKEMSYKKLKQILKQFEYFDCGAIIMKKMK